MSGYWIIKGTIKDQAAYEEYARLWAPIAEKYGARFLAGAGSHETREGPEHARVALVVFDSYAQARACYDDPDYQASLQWAFKAYDRELTIVEGT